MISRKRVNKQTAADKISSLLQNSVASLDPEEDDLDETRAQTSINLGDTESDDNEDELPRRRLGCLLEDEDERYAGKKLSRKDLNNSSNEDEEDFNDSAEKAGYQSFEGEGDSEEDEDVESIEGEGDSEEDENVESIEDGGDLYAEVSGYESDIKSDDDVNFKHMSDANVAKDISKGVCVKNQVNIWENLLEMRIKLQKCLIASNKMPQYDTYKEIKNDTDFCDKATEVNKNVTHLLDKFLLLQSLFLKRNSETKSILKTNDDSSTETHCEYDDEEIPSDSDEEMKPTDDKCLDLQQNRNGTPEKPNKKRKLQDYEQCIAEVHNKYRKYSNSVIQKWNDKTKILLSKTKDTTSVLNQIDYVLSNKEKLLKRTQTKRSTYEIVGKTNQGQTDPEIFDDDDFYHMMLRELITYRSADLTDPVQLGREWVQLQNLRTKMKRSIDTRATKGRKIRYAVHSKLVNFMASMDNSKWSDSAKTDLYKSLFGGGSKIMSKTN